jgi:hypothetical protein
MEERQDLNSQPPIPRAGAPDSPQNAKVLRPTDAVAVP